MSADRDALRQAADAFLVEAPQILARIRRHRPEIELPESDDILAWTPADLRLFAEATGEWGAYYDSVHDRVALFVHVGIERATADGLSAVPDGFAEALADDDIAELDRLMSLVEAQRPDLFALPGWSS